MSDKEYVVQCSLIDERKREHIAFIPKRLAHKGNPVVIPDVPGNWIVREVYSSMEYSEANERSRDFDKQRDWCGS